MIMSDPKYFLIYYYILILHRGVYTKIRIVKMINTSYAGIMYMH